MNEDPFELPLFERPRPDLGTELGDAPLQRGEDTPIVVETLDMSQHSARETEEEPQAAGVGARLAAGFVDLLVHAALGAVLIGGSSLLGAPVESRHALPLGFVVLVFSYLYFVVPLAFWGRTPGMAVAGLRVRSLDDEPLSLPQAGKHWLAVLLTAATGGLGTLLALGGRSLADRLSGSQTLQQ